MQQSSPSLQPHQKEPLPEARVVAPGIWKISLPIPFPLRTVNVHALVGSDGWALIDAGMGMPESRTAFWAGLERAGLSLNKLRTIVLTHHHPDHIGLSAELQEQSGAAVYMHPIDEASVQIIWSGTMPERFRSVSQFFGQHGLPPTDFWFTQVDPEVMRNIIRVPPHEAITPVEDNHHLNLAGEDYRVIWTPGHSDGHICLFRERDGVFLAADHVLPRITPNVGLYSEKERENPLGDYLNSLRKVATLPASIVLPGHGEPFNDLAGRTAEIIEHHRQREMQILTLLKEQPQHAYQVAKQLFGDRLNNSEARRMAVAEALSHLEYLRFSGRVERHRTEDGLILYAVL
ncbi:MAG TPA: MBL fold metallo-hydrolase [Ktedonobacteraceae bacterium]|nr:MBL fold metallo-hydrolase [Ktedonobacteraceae bacterium]